MNKDQFIKDIMRNRFEEDIKKVKESFFYGQRKGDYGRFIADSLYLISYPLCMSYVTTDNMEVLDKAMKLFGDIIMNELRECEETILTVYGGSEVEN